MTTHPHLEPRLRKEYSYTPTPPLGISDMFQCELYLLTLPYMGRVAQSVERPTTCWTVRDRIPVRTRFSARPDRPWGPPASCKMGTGSFPGVKCGRGVLLTTHPLLLPRSWKSRAITLPTLWATPGL